MTSMSPTPHSLCPHCRGQLSLPEDLDPRDVVRCPLCRREFEASQLIPLVPQVEIVRRERPTTRPAGFESPGDGASPPPPGPALDSPAASEAFPSIRRESAATTQAHIERANIVRKRYFSHDQLSRGAGPVATRRARRRPRSTSMEILKVVAGGLLAFPVAQLILWWAAGRDPFHLGEPVSRYVRYLVPPQFRVPLPEAAQVDKPPAEKPVKSHLDAETPFDFGPRTRN